jgi:hypothetical protein
LSFSTSASPAAADQALDGEDGVFGVGDGLPLGGLADEAFVSVKATMDGVVRAPSEFSMTRGWLPSMMATQELVVPRSIPITLAMFRSGPFFQANWRCGSVPAPDAAFVMLL